MTLYNETKLDEALTIPDTYLALDELSNGLLSSGIIVSIAILIFIALKSGGYTYGVSLFSSSSVGMVLTLLLIYFSAGTLGYAMFALFLVIWVASAFMVGLNG